MKEKIKSPFFWVMISSALYLLIKFVLEAVNVEIPESWFLIITDVICYVLIAFGILVKSGKQEKITEDEFKSQLNDLIKKDEE